MRVHVNGGVCPEDAAILEAFGEDPYDA